MRKREGRTPQHLQQLKHRAELHTFLAKDKSLLYRVRQSGIWKNTQNHGIHPVNKNSNIEQIILADSERSSFKLR